MDNEKREIIEQDENVLKIAKKINNVKGKAKKAIGLIFLCVVCFGLGAFFFNDGTGFIGEKVEKPDDGTVTVNTVKTIIKPASELVTGKYYFTNAVSDEDPVSALGVQLPGTTNKYVFKYDGIISAGYDLKDAKINVDNNNNIIYISLPEMKILSSEVDEDSFNIVYQDSSVFNDNDLEQNSKTRAACEKMMIKKAKGDQEFINLTRENAEGVLKSFLTSSGDTKDYKVKLKYTEEK